MTGMYKEKSKAIMAQTVANAYGFKHTEAALTAYRQQMEDEARAAEQTRESSPAQS